MGEMADDMVEGLSCSWCGIYFEREHGYPVACKSCWADAKKRGQIKVKKPPWHGIEIDEKTGIQPATEKEL